MVSRVSSEKAFFYLAPASLCPLSVVSFGLTFRLSKCALLFHPPCTLRPLKTALDPPTNHCLPNLVNERLVVTNGQCVARQEEKGTWISSK